LLLLQLGHSSGFLLFLLLSDECSFLALSFKLHFDFILFGFFYDLLNLLDWGSVLDEKLFELIKIVRDVFNFFIELLGLEFLIITILFLFIDFVSDSL